MPQEMADRNSGISLAMSNDVIVAGMPGAKPFPAFNDAGAVQVFRRVGNTWRTEIIPIFASNFASDSDFGKSVSLSDSTLLVGSEGSNSNVGAAYFFKKQAPIFVTGLAKKSMSQSNISIYPNPATDRLEIAGSSKGAFYQLSAITGQVVLTGTINTNKQQIMLHQPAGLYLLTINDGEFLITQKVIVE